MVMTSDRSLGACKEFEQDLVLYHYQECTGGEQQKVESHLESCAACRRFLAELSTFLPATITTDEPSPEFWQNYNREMRAKLAEKEGESGWKWLASFFRPWSVPAIATAMILALAVTLTLTKGQWPLDSQEKPEVLEMAADADFLESIDFLDSMDLLEAVEGQEAQTGEATPQHL